MSWQLACLNAGLRLFAKPKLRRTQGPERARREFQLSSGLLRRPPFLRDLSRPGGLHWISTGPCVPGTVLLYFHGGGYITGSPLTHCGVAGRLSKLSGIEVCSVDYPLAQVAPFPAQFEAAVAAWCQLQTLGYAPHNVLLAGDSAGGGLALALLARLCCDGGPPAGLVAFSPWTDLDLTGTSLRKNRSSDPFLPVERVRELVSIIMGDAPADARRDPRISPVYGDFPDCPPVLIHYSETEILADDARRMVARLRGFGAEVSTEILADAPHAWPVFDGWIPEARRSLGLAASFAQESLAAISR